MMTVWRVIFNRFKYLQLGFNREIISIPEEMRLRFGRAVEHVWHPQEVVFYISSGLSDLVPPDICLHSWGGLACNERALPIIHPLVKDHVEVLPLTSYGGKSFTLVNPLVYDPPEITQFIPPEGRWYALNILTILDCLDYSRSEIELRDDNGKRKFIRRYIFKENCVEDMPIFLMRERVDWIFATDPFKQLIESHNLRGLMFERVD